MIGEDWGICRYHGCPDRATETVVTWDGWAMERCRPHARAVVMPQFDATCQMCGHRAHLHGDIFGDTDCGEIPWDGNRHGLECGCPGELHHESAPGYDFMPAGWCGGCEICDHYPAPAICVKCTYETSDRTGEMPIPVMWPCELSTGVEENDVRAAA